MVVQTMMGETAVNNSNGVVLPMDEITVEMKKKDDILQCFYDITSMDVETRLKSITTLITTLKEIQDTFKPEHHKDITRYVSKVVEKTKVENEQFSPELNYSLKRLVIGLASTRDSARMGFSISLSEILHTFKDLIDLSWFFDFLAHHMDLTGKNLGERESHFGRLFGIMAIIKSSRLQEYDIVQLVPTKSISYNYNAPQSENIIECLLEQLLYLSKKKAMFTELSYEILVSLLEQIDDAKFEKLWAYLKPIIPKSPEEYSPDLLALLLFISQRYKKFNLIKHTSGWNHESIFHLKNLNLLKNSYRESSKSSPRVHKLWKFTFEILLADHHDNATISEFWLMIVEENLFKSTSQRKYLGLQLFEMLLPLVHPEIISDIFSTQVILSLSESLKKTSSLHEVGIQALQCISKTADISQAHRLALVLFFSKEYDRIDANIAVDVISELVKNLDAAGIKLYFEHLYRTFYNQEKAGTTSPVTASTTTEEDMDVDEVHKEANQEKLVNTHRHWVISQIGYVTKEIVQKPNEFIVELEPTILNLLQFLYFNSYFLPGVSAPVATPAAPVAKGKKNVKAPAAPVLSEQEKFLQDLQYNNKPVPELTQTTRDSCFNRFCSVLEELSFKSLHTGSIDGSMSNGELWATKLAQFQFDILVSKHENKPMLATFVPMGTKNIEKLFKIIQSIHQSPQAKSNQLVGFELLFAHVSLQYLTEPQEISEIIEDLVDSFQDLTNPKKPAANKKSAATAADRPLPFMILLDNLIGLLDKPSHVLRVIIKQFFSIFADYVSFQVLEHILTMVKAPVEELFNAGEEEEDEEDEDFKPITQEDIDRNNKEKEQQEEEDDDEEDEQEEGSDDEEQEDDDDEMDEDSDDDDDNTVNPELVARLKEKLGKHLLTEDDDEDEDDAAPPSAAEARALDNHLIEIFKSKKEKKNTFADVKSQTINLKIRLIDLLETYIKKFTNNPNEYIFKMMPLMIDATTFDEPSVSNRLIGLFKNKFSQIRSTTDATVKAEELNNLASQFFDNIIKSTEKEVKPPKEKKGKKEKKDKKDKKEEKVEQEEEEEEQPVKENNPFFYLLSGHSLYTTIRVLMSMPAPAPVVPATPKSKSKTAKAVATPVAAPSKFGALDVTMFTTKLNIILDHLLNRTNLVPTTFFTEFSQRFPTLIWSSISKLLSITESVQNDFNLKKMLDIMNALFKRKDSFGENGVLLIEHFPSIVASLTKLLVNISQNQKFKPQTVVAVLNILVNLIQNVLTFIKLDQVQSLISCKDVEHALSVVYKNSQKQANKDLAKRILRLLDIQQGELYELEKKKKQEKEEKKEAKQSKKKDIQNKMIENIEKSKKDRKNATTDAKVENKVKSRPKKKEDEVDALDKLDDDEEDKQVVEKVNTNNTKKNNKSNNSNSNNNNKSPSKPTSTDKKRKEPVEKVSKPIKKKQKQ
ncbi:hypothetical protein CYY_002345 [Polysphondylium violaceum]|uniref:Myb domain-containing protein n=1 Tax=Polysphondylium violaceum TaxID=133409 RepID=A0A8J4Q094_9MYCE|nr:hypothetical protein CYY_002345 [Polysphondylium violaceum]